IRSAIFERIPLFVYRQSTLRLIKSTHHPCFVACHGECLAHDHGHLPEVDHYMVLDLAGAIQIEGLLTNGRSWTFDEFSDYFEERGGRVHCRRQRRPLAQHEILTELIMVPNEHEIRFQSLESVTVNDPIRGQ